jgi:hypothetical protein
MKDKICRCCGNKLIEESADNPNVCGDCAQIGFADNPTPMVGGAEQSPTIALGEQLSGDSLPPGANNGGDSRPGPN